MSCDDVVLMGERLIEVKKVKYLNVAGKSSYCLFGIPFIMQPISSIFTIAGEEGRDALFPFQL